MDDDVSRSDVPRRPRRVQFSLLAIFVLLTVCAAIAGLTRAIPLPPFARYLVAGYLICLAIPLLLRIPNVLATLLASSAEMRRIRQERERLREWADQRRREHRSALQDGNAPKN
jgi:hypothetical protein